MRGGIARGNSNTGRSGVARILVTGAGGFIGRALCPLLVARGHHVIAGLRRAPTGAAPTISGVEPRILGDISPEHIWANELSGAEVVIHLAQRAHRRALTGALSGEPVAAVALARAAAKAGAHRFLYASSIKAMGEVTLPGRPFRATDPACPGDAYGRSKLMTEEALTSAATSIGLDLAILRPPLVYGPGVGGNFRALARLARSGLPLPFGAVDNRRSLIFVENLVDLIATAAVHSAAPGRVLLARDGADLPTATLIRVLATGQGKQARLFAVPEAMLAALRLLPLCGPVLSRMTLSLQVDDTETRDLLGWEPPVAAEAGLTATARSLAVR
jgi:nucleoside-diphosphate-sugar epimerase